MIRQQIAGREIVAAVGDQIVAGDDLGGVVGAEPHRVGLNPDIVVDRGQRRAGALDLEVADPLGLMHDLALKVGQIDPVIVDHAERADPGGGEVEQQRRAEPAGADHQHARRQQLFLPLLADLVEDQMARIAPELLFAQFHWDFLPRSGRPYPGCPVRYWDL